MSKLYIGIDNGISGNIGWILPDGYRGMLATPTIKQQSYTKKKQGISRLDAPDFRREIELIIQGEVKNNILCVLERPMINPGRFKASISAARCLEAELCILELLKVPYMYCDSREWQHEFLPAGCKGDELKKKSKEIGLRLFPDLSREITMQKDADSIFIAEWARRKGL